MPVTGHKAYTEKEEEEDKEWNTFCCTKVKHWKVFKKHLTISLRLVCETRLKLYDFKYLK
jgi:hypothetical protein